MYQLSTCDRKFHGNSITCLSHNTVTYTRDHSFSDLSGLSTKNAAKGARGQMRSSSQSVSSALSRQSDAMDGQGEALARDLVFL